MRFLKPALNPPGFPLIALERYLISLKGIARRFRKRGNPAFFEAWLGQGSERRSGLPLQVAYAGVERHKNYLFRNIFGNSPAERPLGKHKAWDLVNLLEEKGETSLIFFEVTETQRPFFDVPARFKIPDWITLKLDFSEQELTAGKRFSKLRRCFRRAGYDYQLTNGKSGLPFFYKKLYVPFTRQRHHSEAYLYSYKEVKKRLGRGELLLAMRNGIPEAGMVLEYRSGNAEAYWSCFGMKDEDTFLAGALNALMFRGLLRFHEKGFRTLNLGYSRAFLKDGPLRFKARLGAYATPDYHRSSGWLTVRFLDYGPAVESFFASNPFISLDEQGLPYGVMFAASGAGLDAQQIEDLLRDSFCGGLRVLEIYSDRGSGQNQQLAWRRPPPESIRICSVLELAGGGLAENANQENRAA